MKKTIAFFMLVFSLSSCNYKHSLPQSEPQSEVLANEFFNGKIPPEVTIPDNLKGKPNEKYKVVKVGFTLNNKNIKVFYTINRNGMLGKMYVDGFNLNTADTTKVVALTREKFIAKLASCPDVQCVMKVYKEAANDCALYQDATNCWYCKKFGGTEKKGVDNCP